MCISDILELLLMMQTEILILFLLLIWFEFFMYATVYIFWENPHLFPSPHFEEILFLSLIFDWEFSYKIVSLTKLTVLGSLIGQLFWKLFNQRRTTCSFSTGNFPLKFAGDIQRTFFYQGKLLYWSLRSKTFFFQGKRMKINKP